MYMYFESFLDVQVLLIVNAAKQIGAFLQKQDLHKLSESMFSLPEKIAQWKHTSSIHQQGIALATSKFQKSLYAGHYSGHTSSIALLIAIAFTSSPLVTPAFPNSQVCL